MQTMHQCIALHSALPWSSAKAHGVHTCMARVSNRALLSREGERSKGTAGWCSPSSAALMSLTMWSRSVRAARNPSTRCSRFSALAKLKRARRSTTSHLQQAHIQRHMRLLLCLTAFQSKRHVDTQSVLVIGLSNLPATCCVKSSSPATRLPGASVGDDMESSKLVRDYGSLTDHKDALATHI